MYRKVYEALGGAANPWQFFSELAKELQQLSVPEKLTGHGPRKVQRADAGENLRYRVILFIHFEEIRQRLGRKWPTGLNVLLAEISTLSRRIVVARDREPTRSLVAQWQAAARSADEFAYRLLAHARRMGVAYLKKEISEARRERERALGLTDTLDPLPSHLRKGAKRRRLSSAS
jgi:hypothetical protein